MDAEAWLRDPATKRTYVAVLFDVIAPGYDAFTRLFSFGMDWHWKRTMIREAVRGGKRNPVVVDLACGTADMLCSLAVATRPRIALGVDISRRMLEVAARRPERRERGVHLGAADMMALGIRSARADIVAVAYGLRSAPSAEEALKEAARVLRPGGLLLVLDLYRPSHRLWRELFLAYMRYAGNVAGWLWHREPRTYGYLAASIQRHTTVTEFSQLLTDAGLVLERVHPRLGGAVCIHVARKLTTVRSVG